MKKSVSSLIIVTFLSAIVIGAVLLMLPVSTVSGSMNAADALFTSASAVTVTGLIVVDTATYFTLFGKTVILLLIQFGGLGFMTFSTLIILLVARSISITDKFIIVSDFTTGNYKNVADLIKKIFILTFGFELLGTLILYIQFSHLEAKERLFAAVFHSVSAFCNAGFSVFGSSLENFTADPGINITFCILIIAGGIGFLVLSEIFSIITTKSKTFGKISLHAKLVVITSLILITAGLLVIFVEELLNQNNPLSPGAKLLSALFQSVTARTAGFNTINLNVLSHASIFFIFILMFIGASPGSTGGGVKTSSAGMVLAYFRSRLQGRKQVDIFYRHIPASTIEKAFIVIILSLLIIAVSFLLLLTFESTFNMLDLLFETVSAFGTVGLSLGLTADLSLPSKLVVIMTMFIGRIGPLTLLVVLSRREGKGVYHYPEENVMIG
jgi:trk system potassium uptake protein TrkH